MSGAQPSIRHQKASALRSDGSKYSINGTDTTTGAVTCGLNPVWTQSLATFYGLVFGECNADKLATPTGRMYAAAGAKVADVAAQIDRQFALDGFNNKDLVTVLAGANDVLELYAQYPAQDAGTLGNAAQARGEQLAAQVNRIVDADGRIILSTTQDMGLSPFALKEKAANADTDRAALLTELSRRFNAGLRLKIRNDGHYIGLILTDELMRTTSAGRIALALPDQPVMSDLDPDAFAILFRNIVENALRHGSQAEPITVELSQGGRLTVANAGPLVPTTTLSRLRRRFERGDGDGNGSGLGLAIVAAIADRIDGNMIVTSPRTGSDTGFEASLSLPVANPAEMPKGE